MKRILSLLIVLTLASCRYFNVSPVNGITTKNLTEKPTQSEMIGIWEVDKFSYELNEEKGYEKKKIELNDDTSRTFLNDYDTVTLSGYWPQFFPSSIFARPVRSNVVTRWQTYSI